MPSTETKKNVCGVQKQSNVSRACCGGKYEILLRQIGAGAFGSIHRGIDSSTKATRAFKFAQKLSNRSEPSELEDEHDILTQLTHIGM